MSRSVCIWVRHRARSGIQTLEKSQNEYTDKIEVVENVTADLVLHVIQIG